MLKGVRHSLSNSCHAKRDANTCSWASVFVAFSLLHACLSRMKIKAVMRDLSNVVTVSCCRSLSFQSHLIYRPKESHFKSECRPRPILKIAEIGFMLNEYATINPEIVCSTVIV